MNLIPNRFLFRVAYPVPLRRRAAARRRRAARSAGGLPHRQLRGHGRPAQLRRRAPGVERGRPGACRWSCAARSSRRSATPPGRAIPTASRCGSTRATPAPATAPAATCHQFHFLPAGGGADKDEPAFVQGKINRAMQDAPPAPAGSVPFQFLRRDGRMAAGGVSAGGRPARLRPGTEPAPGLLLRDPRRGTGRTGAERRAGLSLCGRPELVERAGTGPAEDGERMTAADRKRPGRSGDRPGPVRFFSQGKA